MADIFISYSKQDTDAAHKIREGLTAAGYSCWMAPDDIQGSRTWAAQILDAIDECKVLLILISGNANESGHVANEVTVAFDRNKAILPVRVEDVQPRGPLEYLLKLKQWVDAFPGPVDSHADALVRALAALLEEVGALPPEPAPKKRNILHQLKKRKPSVLAVIVALLALTLCAVVAGVGVIAWEFIAPLPEDAALTDPVTAESTEEPATDDASDSGASEPITTTDVNLTAQTEVSGNTMRIFGTADVPDWSVIRASTEVPTTDGGSATIEWVGTMTDRAFSFDDNDMTDWKPGTVEIKVVFSMATGNPDYVQPDETLKLFGEHGEKITSPQAVQRGEEREVEITVTATKR